MVVNPRLLNRPPCYGVPSSTVSLSLPELAAVSVGGLIYETEKMWTNRTGLAHAEDDALCSLKMFS